MNDATFSGEDLRQRRRRGTQHLMRALAAVTLAAGAVILAGCRDDHKAASATTSATAPVTGQPANSAAGQGQPEPGRQPNNNPQPQPEVWTMEVAQAVMVTVELDFGSQHPTIPDALSQVDRRYQPVDGQGRTFAILDAYGEPAADGKLHISMHVSSEKPGLGSLVFRRTGEVLWQGKIVPAAASAAPAEKRLTIYIDNGAGKSLLVDGSNNPKSVLDARINGVDKLVRDAWPDGAEREVTFVYSACGCPVKVMVRRTGDRTIRTNELPVMFPDDPAALTAISGLMRW